MAHGITEEYNLHFLILRSFLNDWTLLLGVSRCNKNKLFIKEVQIWQQPTAWRSLLPSILNSVPLLQIRTPAQTSAIRQAQTLWLYSSPTAINKLTDEGFQVAVHMTYPSTWSSCWHDHPLVVLRKKLVHVIRPWASQSGQSIVSHGRDIKRDYQDKIWNVMYLGTLESVGLRAAAATILDPAAIVKLIISLNEHCLARRFEF